MSQAIPIVTEVTLNRITIEGATYEAFCKAFRTEAKYRHLRFGQAFHQYFKLDRLSDKEKYDRLYQLDSSKAVAEINRLVEFN